MVIYENKIKAIGADADEFKTDGMIILFGEGAPDELKDSCYIVEVMPLQGTIEAGHIMKIGSEEFKITAVGEEAPVTLNGLGHCTLNFSGQTEADLPGSIYLEEKPVPEISLGTAIQIIG